MIDHTNCTHPRTPAGRRACRAQVSAGAPAPVAPDYVGEHIRRTAANHAMKARMDREYDEVRIQPRRSGARVAAKSSTCVQAALHTGRGRCACGWHTEGF